MKLLGVAVLVVASVFAEAIQRVRSVCETLDHIRELNGQVVAGRREVSAINGLWIIRGVYVGVVPSPCCRSTSFEGSSPSGLQSVKSS